MKKIFKLALRCSVALVSIVPMAYFLVNDYAHDDSYFLELFYGQADLRINIPHNSFMIFSHIVLGFYGTQLSYILLVIGSTVVFFVSLILIALVEEPVITKIIIRLKSTLNLNRNLTNLS